MDDKDSGISFDNLYELLGCSKNATFDEIRKLYLEISKQLHPDKQGQSQDFDNNVQQSNGNNSTESGIDFAKVTAAYTTLSDHEKRLKHDAMWNRSWMTSTSTTLLLTKVMIRIECHAVADHRTRLVEAIYQRLKIQRRRINRRFHYLFRAIPVLYV